MKDFKKWLQETMTSTADIARYAQPVGIGSHYKPCPKCGGEMTNKSETGDTFRGTIRCLSCGQRLFGLHWLNK